MGKIDFDKQIAAIVDQLAERFNLAIATAVDDKQAFEQGEKIFQEALVVLDYYNCQDIAVEQIINFSKVAFFRKRYDRAFYYAVEAVNRDSSNKELAGNSLHAMSYRLLELVLVETQETMCGIGFEDLQEILLPKDYCQALQNVYAAAQKVKTAEERQLMTRMLQGIILEVLRQGLRREKNGDIVNALLLQKTVLPLLNPKRAAVIKLEIEKMEGTSCG